MIDISKQYRTRDGRPVRILCVDGPNKKWPVVGFIESQVTAHPELWMADGRFYDKCEDDENDLVVAPEKRRLTGWVNVYQNGSNVYHETRNCADRNASQHRIACIEVNQEYEVGQGLEDKA